MSQDHKKAGEGDTGLNTGGMGAYAPTPLVTPEMLADYETNIVQPTLAGLKADGIDFRGTLYIGLMLTQDGPKVLEFNVRFGDPETQVILPLLDEDLVPVLLASAKGEDLPRNLKFKNESAMIVVVASKGYPESYPKGEIITIPVHTAGKHRPHPRRHQAKRNWRHRLGRRKSARSSWTWSYPDPRPPSVPMHLCDSIDFTSKFLRRDIGHRELNRS